MSSATPPPSPRVLGDRYSLTTRIAIGGMGEVWEANDQVLGRQVAVKILRDDLIDSPVFLERFRAEARHTAALAHPGIASIFDYGEDRTDGKFVAYLVMELVPGQPLSKVLADRGALPVNMVLSLLAQAAEALHAAHALGVVHRDVKPGNLLLLDDGKVKVTDFGVARAIDSVALTEVGQVIGTARYLAPEQALGAEATPASDVYSLGVVGFEMLAGHPPFAADNVGALAMAHVHQPPPPLPPTVPSAVQAAINEALSKDPADRPVDAHAFAVQLRRLQLSTMAPPGASPHAADQGDTALITETDERLVHTRVIGADDIEPLTAIMPPGRISSGDPSLGLSGEAYASRRQRRRIAVGVIAAGVVVFALLQLGGDGAEPLKGITPATTPTPVSGPVVVDPAVLITPSTSTSTTTTTTSNAKEKGNGKGNGKPKG